MFAGEIGILVCRYRFLRELWNTFQLHYLLRNLASVSVPSEIIAQREKSVVLSSLARHGIYLLMLSCPRWLQTATGLFQDKV